jgi:glycosyltransferase involved in cell wall biosynthesis
MADRLLSVVLPVHNQADHVRDIVADYAAALERLPTAYELVLVPNACRDTTAEVCATLAAELPTVRVADCERGGWGIAVRRGLAAARGDLLCYTNSARTTAEDLSLMCMYALTHPDVVVKANRKIRDNWRRRLGSLVYNIQCRVLFDLNNWDVNGTPKVFPRAFGRLLELTRDDDLIDAEFSLVCRREDYRMLEIPVFSHRRHGGKSTTRYSSAVKMYAGAISMWMHPSPSASEEPRWRSGSDKSGRAA